MNPMIPAEVRRLRGMTWFALAWGVLVAGRLAYLQVHRHEALKERAAKGHEIKVPVPAARGDITDRDGRILVSSIATKSLGVLVPRVTDPARAAAVIEAAVPSLRGSRVRERIEEAVADEQRFLSLKRHLDPAEAAAIDALLHPPREARKKLPKGQKPERFDWIDFRDTSRRDRTSGALAAHVLGSVKLDDKENETGIEGVERSLDADLRGNPGSVFVLADSHKREIEALRGTPARPGATVALTIAAPLQRDVEKILARAVSATGALSGAVVVMDPRNGDVLAMASHPSFDPDRKPKAKPKSKGGGPDPDWSRRVNLAVSAPSEPGSVAKFFTFSAALETTSLRPETWINCLGGTFPVGRGVIRDTHGYWSIPMEQVLWVSSNVGTIQLALTMGQRNLHDYLHKFGFGARTGIELPNESRGRVASLAQWRKNSHVHHAIGYEYSVTTLQVAQAVSTIANGGERVAPRIVLWKQPSGGERVAREQPAPVRVLRRETALDMIRMSQGVILRGTGKDAAVDGYHAGGKTGTARRIEGGHYVASYNASFAGMAPVNQPRVVVAVTLHRTAQMAAATAAPVFRDVTAASLRYLGVKPDYEPERKEPAGPQPLLASDNPPAAVPGPAHTPARIVPAANVRVSSLGPVVPDLRGMDKREVTRAALELEAEVDYIGKGVVVSQAPAPGTVLQAGQRLQVRFDR